ncbi:hypothetical protein BGZ97_008862, partial [Linnemannia gamsii]
LDLGPFGLVEIKGIPLNVKTTMAGLQGLKDIKFVSLVNLNPDAWISGFTFVTTIVNIHNPSQLTLKIGDMSMAAGYGGYGPDDRIGFTQLYNLLLVPGDNIVPSLLGQNSALLNAAAFANATDKHDVTMTLWANSSATTNPALNAGLTSLSTSVLLPKQLIVVPSPPLPYGDVWSVKILPDTVNTGIVEVSAVFNNPYLYEFSMLRIATDADGGILPEIQGMMITPPQQNNINLFDFTQDLNFSLQKGESKTVKFPMKLRRQGSQANMLKNLDYLLSAAAAGPFKTMSTVFVPKIIIHGYPAAVLPDYTTNLFYKENGGMITLQTGPDFPMIKDWFYKQYGITTTPTSVATSPPTVVPSTIPTPDVTPAPTLTPPPEVTPPPVAPAA